MDDNTNNLRESMRSEDLEQDRVLIMKKIQQRKRSQLRQSMKAAANDDAAETNNKEGEDDGYLGTSERSGLYYSQVSGSSYYNEQDAISEDDYYNMNDSIHEDLLDVQAAHQEDEYLIGGRIEDGQEESLETMNQALTSPPTAWWAMRKQWQKRRGTMMNLVGLRSPSVGGAPSGLGEDDFDGGPDASYTRRGFMLPGEAGIVGHPVMLEDPTSIGYDSEAFRQNPYATHDKKKRTPSVMYVSRDVLQKRKTAMMMYIIAALCVVFLFMFVLEQRKLSHYAMVESPISLSAYLAGEELMAKGQNRNEDSGNSKVTLGDLGLEEFGKVDGIPQLEFGNIEVNPNDPIANPELANDPLVGDHPHRPQGLDGFPQVVHGAHRFEILKGVVVGWGVTPAEIFENHASPQYRALSWMAHDDVLRYTPNNDHWIKKIIQRYALVTIYHATEGPGWTNTVFFMSNYDECNWHRVYMGYFLGAGHCEGGYITALALWSNNLKGALPPEIGSLASLETLSVFDNLISAVPPRSLARLTSLNRLYLQKNSFKGDINFLCPNPSLEFKSDCGKVGGVNCTCCTGCGFNRANDKSSMMGKW